ncbi:uncharacterized protein LOC114255351 [Monomorium pharaonis]|uniref:uncharacterized protein LOC114255351 n=1 Tax=Monomorium pharaonis TaxID=307658 RepID=UPI001746DC1B|nr:uncharacterized protein LOC114255351 [Monomorium pharaonis]
MNDVLHKFYGGLRLPCRRRRVCAFLFIHIFLTQNVPLRTFIVQSETILTVVDYLLERLERGQIYTWVGSLLLAINPSGEIATGNIYDLPRAREYDSICDETYKEASPHIFAVAARAHYRIVQGLGKPRQVNFNDPEDSLRNLFLTAESSLPVFLLHRVRAQVPRLNQVDFLHFSLHSLNI